VPAGLNDEAREALERFAETTKDADPRQALLEAAQGS
jgi:hypothetical protein